MVAAIAGAVMAGVALAGCAARQPVSEPATTEASPPRVRLVAVSWRGEFFAQDPADGFLVSVGHTGFTRINSLTVTPDDRVLAVADSGRADGVRPVLIEIDPATGRGSVVCELDREADVRALACAPSGALYLIESHADDEHRCSVAQLDPELGSIAELARLDSDGVNGLEFAPDGELYALLTDGERQAAGIVTLNPADWQPKRASGFMNCPWPMGSLAFDGIGACHVSYRIDTAVDEWLSTIVAIDCLVEDGPVHWSDAAYTLRGSPVCGIGFLGAREWYENLYRPGAEVAEYGPKPWDTPPKKRANSGSVVFTLTRASAQSTTDLMNRTRTGNLDIAIEADPRPHETPFLIVARPILERCIVDGGADVTKLWDRAGSRVEPVTSRSYGPQAKGPSLFSGGTLHFSFGNLPPESCARVSTISGRMQADFATAVSTLSVDLQERAFNDSIPGWRVAIEGSYDQATKTYSGTMEVMCEDCGEAPLDLRRVITLSARTPGWNDHDIKVTGRGESVPGGARIEFQVHWNSGTKTYTPPPSKLQVRCATELQRRAVPFEFHDVILHRSSRNDDS